jgi:putative membrane protein
MAALAMLAVPALAAKSQLSGSDRNFVKKAAQGGVTEVTLGKLALNRAQSADVKQFGRRMVTDHSAANAKLAQVARIKGIALPKSPDKEQKGVINRLSRLSGAAFDRAYMQDMVKDHTKDVAEFQKESTKARDTDVKAFAADSPDPARAPGHGQADECQG